MDVVIILLPSNGEGPHISRRAGGAVPPSSTSGRWLPSASAAFFPGRGTSHLRQASRMGPHVGRFCPNTMDHHPTGAGSRSFSRPRRCTLLPPGAFRVHSQEWGSEIHEDRRPPWLEDGIHRGAEGEGASGRTSSPGPTPQNPRSPRWIGRRPGGGGQPPRVDGNGGRISARTGPLRPRGRSSWSPPPSCTAAPSTAGGGGVRERGMRTRRGRGGERHHLAVSLWSTGVRAGWGSPWINRRMPSTIPPVMASQENPLSTLPTGGAHLPARARRSQGDQAPSASASGSPAGTRSPCVRFVILRTAQPSGPTRQGARLDMLPRRRCRRGSNRA